MKLYISPESMRRLRCGVSLASVSTRRLSRSDIELEAPELRWPGDDTDLVGAVERGEFGDEEWLNGGHNEG